MQISASMRNRVASLALLAACSAVAAAPAPAGAGAPPPRPNIVVVLTDDQRWDTLSVMPTVREELVGRGVTFANAFAVNPLCCPSRASFLTGRYSHSTGVYDNRAPHGGVSWFDHSSTLATWLGAAGYRTAYVGKYMNGYRGKSIPTGWHRWAANSGGYFGYPLNVDGLPLTFGFDEGSYSTDVYAREAASFVASSADPFFLVYAPYAPHGPATPAPRHAGAFADVERWRPRSHNEEDVSDKPRWLRDRPLLTEWEQQGMDDFRRQQLASLLAVDDGVREILDALTASRRLENTIVVYTSDNGLLWGEHRLAERKAAAFEESIRIPFVVRYDALGSRPRTETRLATNIDLAPTLAELAGARAPGAEGTSLLPLLSPAVSVPPAWRRSFLLEHLRGRMGGTAEIPTYCGVRSARYKYVVYSTREEELYDLANDPHELENRAGDPAFRKRLFGMRSDVKELCDPPPPGFTLRWLCTLEGDETTTVLRGTGRADKLCGTGKAETFYGRRHDDVVRAGPGHDAVFGQSGADRMLGGRGRDRLDGGPGADVHLARDGERDRVTCGRGRDVVYADQSDGVAADCERVVTLRRR